jgi:hypothetical protein
MNAMLDKLLGSRTAANLFLHLYHHGETYPSAVAKDFSTSLGQVQRQFDRFEQAGVLVSRSVGRTRVYTFNPKSPVANRLREMIGLFHEAMTITEKERFFRTRRRPRRKGKPVHQR